MEKQVLNEKYLHSDVTFGFELEANVYYDDVPLDYKSYIWDDYIDRNVNNPSQFENLGEFINFFIDDSYDFLNNDPQSRHLIDDTKMYDNVKKKIEKYFPKSAPWIINYSDKIEHDGSLGANGFEWPSHTMKFTPDAIAHCIHFLSNLDKEHIYVDDTCGFHTHISFPNFTLDDVKWIVLNIALKDEYINEFTSMIYNDYKFDFIDYYAKETFFGDIRTAFNEKNFSKLSELLDDEKYRVLRIHPQGTLEWRGPRGFLNEEEDKELIKQFFIKLFKVVNIISDILKSNYIGDYDKKTILELLNTNDMPFGKTPSRYKDFIFKLQDNPKKLYSLKDSPLSFIFKIIKNNQQSTMILSKLLYRLIVMENKQVPTNILAMFIMCDDIFSVKQLNDIIKHLKQPLPIKEMIQCNRWYNYTEQSLILQLIRFLESYSIDDCLNVINNYNGNEKLFVDYFNKLWDLRCKSEMPKIIKNTLENKLNEK